VLDELRSLRQRVAELEAALAAVEHAAPRPARPVRGSWTPCSPGDVPAGSMAAGR
jgi:hypothetical protein